MTGYRTVIFNIVMTLGMGGTVQVADLPPTWRAMFTLGVAAWGLVAILIRIGTTTPIGQKIETDIETRFGITHEQMAALIAKLPQAADMNAVSAQIAVVSKDLDAVRTATTATAETVATLPAAQAPVAVLTADKLAEMAATAPAAA